MRSDVRLIFSEANRAFGFQHLETYFLFPFALDKAAIETDHAGAWKKGTKWIDGLDLWIADESGVRESAGLSRLGVWRRASYTQFDIDSPGYSDLLSFNSIVQHVFFDTNIGRHVDEQENQLRCYTIEIPSNTKLWFEGSDALGASARVEVNDLRLYLSAHSVGILSIGIAASGLSAMEAVWVNRRLRKLYPVDADCIQEGRSPELSGSEIARRNRHSNHCRGAIPGFSAYRLLSTFGCNGENLVVLRRLRPGGV